MAATHCVSLFLPHTIEWVETPIEAKRAPSPPPRVYTHARHKSAIELSRVDSSQASLFPLQTTPLTPVSVSTGSSTDVFGQVSDTHRVHFATPGDPRSLVRSDAADVEWGREPRFNQPRSRAGPLPSGSILDFAKVHEELEQSTRQLPGNKAPLAKLKPISSPPGNHDRGYEGKSWVVQPALQGNGGLTNAMRAVVDAGETEVSWVGTCGFPTDALPPNTKIDIADHLANDYHSDVVFVGDKDFDGHYSHYCKTILWPIFHYQVPDHPKSKAYADHSWRFYYSVNQAFANKIVDSYKRGDTIWVHDYHLLLVPKMVRDRLPDAQIGFFLHTAFPSCEIFRCLSTRRQLLEGMLGANLVAFQTEEYVQHFLQTCARLLAVETKSEGVQLENHFVDVTFQPIGINARSIQEVRQTPEVAGWIEKIKERWGDKKLIVARDKFDNVHGIRQKLLAYELFLSKYPEWTDKAVLVQVATSTNPQAELLTTVSDICARIEFAHHTLEKHPLVFLKQDLEFVQYLALLSSADVLMVSNLRDGMNLTPHEFIYCQDGTLTNSKKHGPLILSEFAGSAALFGDNHIPINPWDYHNQAEAIRLALEMDDAEKERRWKSLHDIVETQTGGRWADQLGKMLSKVHEAQSQRAMTSVPRLSVAQISEKYRKASRRVFFLDYEGTLSPHATNKGISLSQPHLVVDTLNDLMSDAKNIVYVMSGRKPQVLEATFRTATGLGLVAENGCFIRGFGSAPHDWHTAIDLAEVNRWKNDVKTILQYYRERMDGSELEERHCSLIFRFDKVDDQEAALRLAGDCADQINSSSWKRSGVQAVPVHKAVLIEQVEFSKGTAATHVFGQLARETAAGSAASPDFVVVVGNDREDEVVFRWANDLANKGLVRDVFTVSLGKRNTEAQATLTQGSSGLLAVLQKLAKISLDSLPVDYFTKTPKRA